MSDEPPTKKIREDPVFVLTKTKDRLEDGVHISYDGGLVRNMNEVEKQVVTKEQTVSKIVGSLPKDASEIPQVELYLPDVLKGAYFVGHLVTDLDSVAGAIGAAALYGGTPALASDVNSETQFALDYWGVQAPARIEEIIAENPKAEICLVDHQQTSQMNSAINADQIVGVIDHHALQSKTIVTDKPIYIDIRPWGSMSSIIAHTFLTHGRRPEKKVAGMLLCAILSDTLNLQGPTTTDWDRLMVAVLSAIAEVENPQLLAQLQFKAKSKELAHLSSHALVNGDQKTFSFSTPDFTGDIGFAVVETTDDDVILQKVDKLIPEMVACKKEKGLQMLFLAIVNIVKLRSSLLLCGPTEKSLAVASFGGEITHHDRLMDLGERVSRKKEFIPVITKVINGGWKASQNLKRGLSAVELNAFGHLEVDVNDPYGNAERVGACIDIEEEDDEEKKESEAGCLVVG